ncbi:hypothetical protein QQX10_12425 [Demequina sp. SYSU T00039]|uniref:Uncharacterized protein n=1 Tax=Demequina lignilytica TaxID=3051663 RepID=A0AAW7M6G7_9MICO|nr:MULTISPECIES: hypothetical protein [unclassified Demequina]MDN4478874.1 hypothetical protein [Demequina sp. SYSU T00039-1]MDN4488972.1 hypothetical protein [Demequina sp. SYSU T00039]
MNFTSGMPKLPPFAHHGATPTSDPLIPGMTAGGDSAQPPTERPRRGILLLSMVLVLVAGALAIWVLFQPRGDEAVARDAAASLGLTVTDDAEVALNDATIAGGLRVRFVGETDQAVEQGYYFDLDVVTAREPGDDWIPTDVAGATGAWFVGDPPTAMYLQQGDRWWVASPGTPSIYGDDATARQAWHHLRNALLFTDAS